MQHDKRLAAKKLLEQLAAKVDLTAESSLDPAIQRSAHGDAGGQHRDVLLTGVTGYLGAFLLRELLAQTEADVHCLVRARGEDDGLARIKATLDSYELWDPAHASRIHAVAGDLTKPRLGLSEAAFDALAARIDVIYHSGAVVNLVFPYNLLKPANVTGTQEILRLASRGRGTWVQFVSTAGIFLSEDYAGQRILEDAPADHPKRLRVGYMQSKWAAERLAFAARDRGLPVAVYRPTFIGWHSETGVFNSKDFVCGMIDGCLSMGIAPEMDMMVDAVSVDYTSRAIVHMGTRRSCLGKTFHLSSPRPIPWERLVGMLQQLGWALSREPYATWRARLDEAPQTPFYQQFSSMLPEATSDGSDALATYLTEKKFPAFDDRNAREALSGTGIACPFIDEAWLERHLSRLRLIREAGLSPAAPVQAWRGGRG